MAGNNRTTKRNSIFVWFISQVLLSVIACDKEIQSLRNTHNRLVISGCIPVKSGAYKGGTSINGTAGVPPAVSAKREQCVARSDLIGGEAAGETPAVPGLRPV